jgi:tetratricopeptide (TPR) repeat protein
MAVARHQAQIAERRVASLQALSNTLLSDVHDGIRDLPGATPARRMLVGSALAYLDALYREGRDDPSLQRDLASAFEQIGEVQGNPHYPNLGDLEGALESYRRAFELRAALWAQDSSDDGLRRELANSYGHLAVVLGWRGGEDDVAAMRRRALELLDPLVARKAPTPEALHDAARIRSEHGWALVWDGRYDDGIAHIDTALAVLGPLAEAAPDDLDLALHLWRALSYRADGLSFSSRDAELLALMEREGIPLLHRLESAHPRHPRVQYGLHVAYDYLGRARRRLARPGAADAYGTSLAYAEAMVRVDPTNQKGQEATMRALGTLAALHADAGRTDDALAAYTRVQALTQRRYDADPGNAEAGNKLASVLRATCRTLVAADRLADALAPCEASAEVQRSVVALSTATVYRGNLGAAYGHLARIHRALAARADGADARLTHRAAALRDYRRGTGTLRAVQAETDGGDPAWEVDPDDLAAEYAALRAEAEGPQTVPSRR